jgi:hypothetical protein
MRIAEQKLTLHARSTSRASGILMMHMNQAGDVQEISFLGHQGEAPEPFRRAEADQRRSP